MSEMQGQRLDERMAEWAGSAAVVWGLNACFYGGGEKAIVKLEQQQ